MRLTIATWNINSVRLRAGLVERLLNETQPDVLCLQETKAQVAQIPHERFAALGYDHMVARGQPGYNGVCVLSRLPLEDAGAIDFCGKGDARHVAARLIPDGADPILIHNCYVPAGGDVPDPDENPKFAHKLAFVDEMTERFALGSPDTDTRAIVLGDLNIAPGEHDVWSSRQLRNVVSHTPPERERFERARAAGGWCDAARRFEAPETKLYSWWSYRAKDWRASDRGRRLDHIWTSPALADGLTGSVTVKEARDWEKPSDHAPVFATLTV